MNEKSYVTVELTVPTIFPDFNKANELPEDHETTHLKIQRLKYKHFRTLQGVAPDEQMREALHKLSGLSHDDLDELDAEDAADITGVVYSFMEKFMKLAGRMASAAQAG